MDRPRYTEKQILCGIRELFSKLGGMNAPFDASTRIDHFIDHVHESNRRWYYGRAYDDDCDDFEFIDFFLGLSYYFRFRCTPEEWTEYFHLDLADHRDDKEDWERLVAPGFTFGALARFIAERAPGVSFGPVTVINRECRPAGVFYGIQRVVKNTIEDAHWFPPPEKSISPSTKIIDTFRGNTLEKFWSQLRWITEEGVPELRGLWVTIEAWGCLAGFLGVLAGILLSLRSDNNLYLLMIPVCAFAAWFVSSLYKYRVNPLPPELQTFRDLAMLIAEYDCDVVRKS